MTRSPARLRLIDIIGAIDLIAQEMAGVSVSAFGTDRRKQWVVERGLEIISEASRRLPEEMKARRPEIPWRQVASIGNILRHEYERVAYDVLWRVVIDHLSPLDAVCREELAAIEPGES